MSPRPLLMIPGPVEVSPRVLAAFSTPPPGHLEPRLIEAFGAALGDLRRVFQAAESAQPFAVAGSGTLAMEMAVVNLIEPGDGALVVVTGVFSDRLAEMLRRAGARVAEARAAVGDVPTPDEVREALAAARKEGTVKALFATHVDTSTGVCVDLAPLAALARAEDLLTVFDGVCSIGGEPFDMAALGADVGLTASQKALGLPPGLALLVAGERALAVRAARRAGPPPLYLDWLVWKPILAAYESRQPSYFATPATNLILALAAGLEELLGEGLPQRLAAQGRAARALQAAWRTLGLIPVPRRPELAAHTLSALRYPPGAGPTLVAAIARRGVTVAGGLHPEIRNDYFRIGHMGPVVHRPDLLRQTVEAVAGGLADAGLQVAPEAAWAAAQAVLEEELPAGSRPEGAA